MNEMLDIVTSRVSRNHIALVFVHAADEIAGDADIQRTTRTTRKDVDVVCATMAV